MSTIMRRATRKSTSSSKGILDFFKGTPRPMQADLLREIETWWDKADVFVIPAPTAFGKTKVIECIARYSASVKKLKSHVLVPTNVLVDQVAESTGMLPLKARSSYTCYTPTVPVIRSSPQEMREEPKVTSCDTHFKACGEHCAACPYVQTVRKAHAFPYSLSNYHTALAHRFNKPVVLIDEAHMLLPLIREAEGKHVWLPEKDGKSLLPHYCDTYGKVADYLAAHPELTGKVWDEIRSELEGGRGRFLLHRGERSYHASTRDALSLLPIDTSKSEKAASFLGGKKVQKLFLLSGTISRTDVEQMALQGKRVVMLQASSPIPVERRPIVRDYVAPMSYMNQQDPQVIDALVSRIIHHAQNHEGKVLVHAPYSLATRIGPALARALPGRVLSHSNHDKAAALRRFREDPQPWVLLGSGLEEGVDLYGEQYTLQLICKVPFPGLGDPAWKWVAEEQPERYAWEAIKKVVQAAGRICRGPDDYGKTIILDQAFERLLVKHRSLLPQYFTEALTDGKDI